VGKFPELEPPVKNDPREGKRGFKNQGNGGRHRGREAETQNQNKAQIKSENKKEKRMKN